MSGSRIFLFSLLALLLLGAVLTWYFVQQNQPVSDIEKTLTGDSETQAAAFTTVTGTSIALNETLAEDTPVIVMVWASWCPSCAGQLETLQKVAATYGDQVSVLAVNRAEPATQAERFLKTVEEIPDVTILLNADDHYYKDVSGYAMPETLIYDGSGTLSKHIRGDFTETVLRTAIDNTLSAGN